MTQGLMGKAETALASARLLLEAGDSDGTINRAYYAMFDAATAALRWAGTAENPLKTHGGMIASFGRNLVQTGRLSPELGRSLNRMHELRVTADYLAEPVPLDKARQGSRKRQRSLAQSVSCWSRHPGNAGRPGLQSAISLNKRINISPGGRSASRQSESLRLLGFGHESALSVRLG
jgi:uncharacterized protein (UPF0332 family)